MKVYIVVEDWTSMYPDPLVLRVGQEVILDKSKVIEELEWENWIWCSDDSKSGWAPVQIMAIQEELSEHTSKAIVVNNYSAHELDVQVNDKLIGRETLNGWIWCRKMPKDLWGWVPARNLKEITFE